VAEIKKSTVRLSEIDLANIAKIIATGAASSESEAIRVALAGYAELVPSLRKMQTDLRKQMQELRASVEGNLTVAPSTGPERKR